MDKSNQPGVNTMYQRTFERYKDGTEKETGWFKFTNEKIDKMNNEVILSSNCAPISAYTVEKITNALKNISNIERVQIALKIITKSTSMESSLKEILKEQKMI